MARPGQQTFAKLQREAAKREKKRAKREKKAARKAEKLAMAEAEARRLAAPVADDLAEDGDSAEGGDSAEDGEEAPLETPPDTQP